MRAAFDWLERDLEGSFAVGLYPTNNKRFFSEGRADATSLGSRRPLLDVTATSARGTTPLERLGFMPEGDRDTGDQVRVLYYLEEPPATGAGDRRTLDLVRYEHRPPFRDELEHAARAVIARGLQAVTLRFFDGADWHDRWDSAAGAASAPRAVEIRLTLATADGGRSVVVSVVYLPLGGRRA